MLQPDYFNPAFIEGMMRQHAPGQDVRLLSCQPFDLDNSASILAVLTADQSKRAIGHFGLTVDFWSAGQRQTRRMVLKIKPHGREIGAMLNSLAQVCGSPLAEVYPTYGALIGFQHTHGRELEVYGKLPSALHPEIFGLFADPANETYLILMEYLEDVRLLNSVMEPQVWTDGHIRQALGQIATWHAQHLGKQLPLDPAYWTDAPSTAYMTGLMPLWTALLQNASDTFPELYRPERVRKLRKVIASIPQYWPELERMPKTLVHNDLNPRNMCFKLDGDSPVLCVYDWELATYHVPQYDVVELLSFVLDADRYALRPIYLDYYRQALHGLTGLFADAKTFQRGFGLAANDFGLHRLGMYMMAHAVSPYPFLPRVVNSYFNTLEQFG